MKLAPRHAVFARSTKSSSPEGPGGAVSLFDGVSWRTLTLLALLAVPSLARAQRPQGEWIIIPGVISTEVVRTIKNDTQRAIQRKVGTIVYEFQSREQSDFGSCWELAKYLLEEVKGQVQTYAVVDVSINGHAVLPILACRSVYLTPQGSLGFEQRAAEKANPDAAMVAAYEQVGELRGRPVALLMKMLKPELVVYSFEHEGQQFRLSQEQTR